MAKEHFVITAELPVWFFFIFFFRNAFLRVCLWVFVLLIMGNVWQFINIFLQKCFFFNISFWSTSNLLNSHPAWCIFCNCSFSGLTCDKLGLRNRHIKISLRMYHVVTFHLQKESSYIYLPKCLACIYISHRWKLRRIFNWWDKKMKRSSKP